jgi:hypothetical protein
MRLNPQVKTLQISRPERFKTSRNLGLQTRLEQDLKMPQGQDSRRVRSTPLLDFKTRLTPAASSLDTLQDQGSSQSQGLTKSQATSKLQVRASRRASISQYLKTSRPPDASSSRHKTRFKMRFRLQHARYEHSIVVASVYKRLASGCPRLKHSRRLNFAAPQD